MREDRHREIRCCVQMGWSLAVAREPLEMEGQSLLVRAGPWGYLAGRRSPVQSVSFISSASAQESGAVMGRSAEVGLWWGRHPGVERNGG